jgi:hypothetical protein
MAEGDSPRWPRFFSLLHWVGALLYITAAATLLVIFRTQLWHYPLLRFTYRVWTSFLASVGSTGAGFVSPILVSFLSIVGTILCIGFLQGIAAMKKHFWENAAITVVVFVTVMLMVYGTQFAWQVAHIGYDEHKTLAVLNKKLTLDNGALSTELEKRKHSIFTNDAVFPNIIYLLQAFQIYRGAQNGKPCVIWITAPPESKPLASVVAQFSNSVSGCHTFGPSPLGNPDLDEEAMRGMIPAVIVVHMARDDRAAGELLMHLGNQIQCRMSYEPLSSQFVHYQDQGKMGESIVWLQFGTNVKWNSELREGGAAAIR